MDVAPIELNFYNEQDEVIETHRRSRIPSYLLDMAINLQHQIKANGQESSDEDAQKQEQKISDADALFDFVVEFYGNKFTREDVKKKTDLIECMAVLRSILARTNQLTRDFAKANPPVPSPKKK